jgi:hypothetical protein
MMRADTADAQRRTALGRVGPPLWRQGFIEGAITSGERAAAEI